jgi:hypothetical protein
MSNDNTNKLNHLKPKEGPVVTHTMVDMNLMTHSRQHKYNLKQPIYMTNIPKPSLMKPKVNPVRIPISSTYHHDLPGIYNGYHKKHLSINFGMGSTPIRQPLERNYIKITTPAVLNSNIQPIQTVLETVTDESSLVVDIPEPDTCVEEQVLVPDTCVEEQVLVPDTCVEEQVLVPVQVEELTIEIDASLSTVLLDVPALEPLPPAPLTAFENDIVVDLKTTTSSNTSSSTALNSFSNHFQVNLKPVPIQAKVDQQGNGAAFLMISLDGGDTWKEPKLPPPKDVKISVVAIGKKVHVCGGVYDSLYHSFDGGDTWDKCKNQPQIHDWTAITINGDEDERIEARTRKGDMYISTDLGHNWCGETPREVAP